MRDITAGKVIKWKALLDVVGSKDQHGIGYESNMRR
jgi:hypothetical protein